MQLSLDYNASRSPITTTEGKIKVDRRDVMRGLAVMFGAELLLPIRAAIAQGIDQVKLTGASLFASKSMSLQR